MEGVAGSATAAWPKLGQGPIDREDAPSLAKWYLGRHLGKRYGKAGQQQQQQHRWHTKKACQLASPRSDKIISASTVVRPVINNKDALYFEGGSSLRQWLSSVGGNVAMTSSWNLLTHQSPVMAPSLFYGAVRLLVCFRFPRLCFFVGKNYTHFWPLLQTEGADRFKGYIYYWASSSSPMYLCANK